MSRRVAVLVLLAVTLAGGLLRAEAAGSAHRRLSADERAYLRLARDLRAHGSYGDPGLGQPRRWAPGTPALFALSGGSGRALEREGGGDGSPASVAQVAVSTLGIPAVFLLAALLAGPLAGVAAALALGFYPPAIAMAATFLSEPLGGFCLAVAACVLVWAWRGGVGRFVAAGAALGVTCLVRADLLAPALVVALGVAGLGWRPWGWRQAVVRAAGLAAATLAVIAPWCVASSLRLHEPVPVTSNGAGTLYIATFLPGNGTVFGFKSVLHGEVCRRAPVVCGRRRGDYRAQMAIQAVAERRRDLPYERALQAAVLVNLRRYALGRPLAFGRMLGGKAWRLWGGPFRGTDVAASAWGTWLHRALVAGAAAGLLAGLWRSRDRRLALLALLLLTATAVNVLFVAEARHNVRLLPVLLAAGAAGWVAVARRRASGPSAAS